MEEIRATQNDDPQLHKVKEHVETELRSGVRIYTDGTLYFGNKICVPQGRFDRKFYPKPTTQLILYTKEELRCINI